MTKTCSGTLQETPLGPITITVSLTGICRLQYGGNWHRTDKMSENGLLIRALNELQEYLVGKRKLFSIPVDWSQFSQFASTVLKQVSLIPFGRISTYKEIALLIDRPTAFRAVGNANASNPIPIIIPCHRVIGTDRHLRGYNGPNGLATKTWLLQLEGQKIVEQRLA
jgi:methylated-DNA-[protein]-cysteine S-methyltransferase